jgi:hypothetical protein
VEFRNSYTIPFSETDVACNGETVDVSGLLRHRVVIVDHANGGLHGSTLTRGTATGISSSGTRYVANFTDAGSEYFAPGDVPANGTFPFSFRLISNDGSPNLTVRAFFHITVNANGEITTFSNEFEIVCR